MRLFSLVVMLAALASVALGATSASALTTYCVGDNPLCPAATPHQDATGANLQTALSNAGAVVGDVNIFLGPGSYMDCSGPFSVTKTAANFRLIGTGAASELINCGGGNSVLYADLQDKNSGISGVKVSSVSAMTGSAPQVELRHGFLDASTVTVDRSGGSTMRTAVALIDAELKNSTVTTNDWYGVAVTAGSGSSTVADSTLVGTPGSTQFLLRNDGTLIVSRSKLKGAFHLATGVTGSYTTIDDSLLELGAIGNAVAVAVSGDGSMPASMLVDDSTIVGSGQSQEGLSVLTSGTGTSFAQLSASRSMIDVTGTNALAVKCERQALGSPTPGWVALAAVAYNSTRQDVNAGSVICSFTDSDDFYYTDTKGPGFVDSLGGDFHLAWDSPWVDTGSSTISPGERDVDGRPRLVRGPAAGAGDPALTDIGAYEYQAATPVVSLTPQGPGVPGVALSLGGVATDADAGETPQLSYSWDFGDGGSASGASTSHAWALPGTYAVTLTATDPAGLSASASTTVTILDKIAPVLTIKKKPKSGTSRKARVSFTSSETATFECKLDRGKFKRCRSPWKKTVKPGKHKLQIRATDQADNVSKVKTVKWTVKKRR